MRNKRLLRRSLLLPEVAARPRVHLGRLLLLPLLLPRLLLRRRRRLRLLLLERLHRRRSRRRRRRRPLDSGHRGLALHSAASRTGRRRRCGWLRRVGRVVLGKRLPLGGRRRRRVEVQRGELPVEGLAAGGRGDGGGGAVGRRARGARGGRSRGGRSGTVRSLRASSCTRLPAGGACHVSPHQPRARRADPPPDPPPLTGTPALRSRLAWRVEAHRVVQRQVHRRLEVVGRAELAARQVQPHGAWAREEGSERRRSGRPWRRGGERRGRARGRSGARGRARQSPSGSRRS